MAQGAPPDSASATLFTTPGVLPGSECWLRFVEGALLPVDNKAVERMLAFGQRFSHLMVCLMVTDCKSIYDDLPCTVA